MPASVDWLEQASKFSVGFRYRAEADPLHRAFDT
jgi:hypothetical protein